MGRPHKPNKQKLRTSEDVFNRLLWGSDDLGVNLDDVLIGFHDSKNINRPSEVPFKAWKPMKDAGEIGFHHVSYFVEKNRVLWDRRSRVDHVFKQSGRTLTGEQEFFDIHICITEDHWVPLNDIPPREMRRVKPTFIIGRVSLPEPDIVCETILFRWCRTIFGEESPFQPLIVECLSLQLVMEESVRKVVAVCGGKNLTSLLKLLSFGPYEKEMKKDVHIVIGEVPHWRDAEEVLQLMEERFTPFSFSVKHLDFSTSASKKYTAGFSLCDLAMESGRIEYLAAAVERFSS